MNNQYPEIRKEPSYLGLAIFLISIVGAALFGVWCVWSLYFRNVSLSEMMGVDNWGQLGDYFGGLLNPVFGFLSLLGLLVTLFLNQRELKITQIEAAATRAATERQAQHMETESKKNEFIKVIEQIHQELSELLERRIVSVDETGKEKEYFYGQVLSQTELFYIIPHKVQGRSRGFHAIGERLAELSEYLYRYSELSENSTVPSFYRRRYAGFVAALQKSEYIEEKCASYFSCFS